MSQAKKKGLLFLLVILALFLAVGWLWQEQRHPVLRIGVPAGSRWGVPHGDRYDFFDETIRRFEEKHPEVRVVYTSGITVEDYPEWLAEQFLGGQEPDVFLVPEDDFNRYAESGALMDLSRTASSDKDFHSDVYYPAVVAYGQYQGKSYALPISCVPTMLFVNKTLLAREGIPMPTTGTWEDFLRICRLVTKDTDGDGVLDQFGSYGYTWQLAAATNGLRPFREDGRASFFADYRMEESVQRMMQIHALAHGQEVTARDFDMGRVAFRPMNFAEYCAYKPYPWRIKKYSSFEWDCLPLPQGPSGDGGSPVQVTLAGISSRTKHIALAWQLLKEFSYDEETQLQLLKHTQELPVRRDVVLAAQQELNDEAPGGSVLSLEKISQVLDKAVTAPKFPRYHGAMMLADKELARIIHGTVPYNNALNKLQKEINAYLKQ